MRFRGLDLNLLIALEALLVERSVSLAALRVHRSQSAMSGSLARLREHFQDELLVSVGHRMVLTSFAEGIVDPVRDLMEQIEDTVEASGAFDPATASRHFTLCVSDYIIEFLMPEVARKVAAASPGTVLDFIPGTRSSFELIENGQADLLVIASFSASELYPVEVVQENDHIILGARDNPGLQHETVTEEEFFGFKRVAGRFGPKRAYSVAETYVQRIGGKKNIEICVPSVVAIPKFLIGTNRIALMHRSIGEAFASAMPLVIRTAPFDLPSFNLILQNHPARGRDAGLEWLKTLIRESFSSRAFIAGREALFA
jgi:LysR family nod box-dependent transcriptional activator